MTLQIFKIAFTIGCVIASLAFVIKLIYEYSLNKDTSSLEFKAFHSDENAVYPSISLCFSESIWRNIAGFNDTKYREFLSGCYTSDDGDCGGTWDASFANVDYDNVTKNLVDYVIGEVTDYADESQDWYSYRKFPEKGKVVEKKITHQYGYTGGNRVYTSRRTAKEKCLTFDIPFKQGKLVRYHSILLNNKIFEDTTRPKKYDFDVSFHYPNQIMRQTSKKYSWTNVSTLLNQSCYESDICSYWGSTYTMTFEVDLVSVLKRRNTGKNPCLEDWKHDTTAMKTKISQGIKCQPSHWKLSSNLTTCSNKTQMLAAMLQEEQRQMPSCNTMERYAFGYNEASGLEFFLLSTQEYIDEFGIDWNSEEMLEEVLSEIQIHFVGRNSIFDYFRIVINIIVEAPFI